MASMASSRWPCWKTARTSITESMSAPVGVYLLTGDCGELAEEFAQGAQPGGSGGGVFRSGKDEEPPPAIRFDGVTQVNRPGIRQPDDRGRMKAHTDHQAFREMLIGRFGRDDRPVVPGFRPCREAPLPDKVFLELRGIDTCAVGIGGILRRSTEHPGELAIEVDQFIGNRLAFVRIGVQDPG